MAYVVRPILVVLLIILHTSLLPACGKKGPLYLPDNKPKAPAESPAVPVTPSPATPTP